MLYIDSVCIDSYSVNPCDQTQWNWPRKCTLGKQKYQESNNRYINLHFPMKNVIISDDILDFYPDSIWIAIELSLSGNSWNDKCHHGQLSRYDDQSSGFDWFFQVPWFVNFFLYLLPVTFSDAISDTKTFHPLSKGYFMDFLYYL